MSGEFSKMFLGHGPIFDLELSLAFKSFFHPIDDWRRNVGLGDGGNGVDSFFSLLVVNVLIGLYVQIFDFGVEFDDGLIFSVFLNADDQIMGGFIVSGFQSSSGFFQFVLLLFDGLH
jgi:hypothetical protein